MEGRTFMTSFTGRKGFKIQVLVLFLLFFSLSAKAQEWNWAVSTGGVGNQDYTYDIATDSDSNVYIVGTIGGSNVVFGSQTINTLQNEWGYIAKYDRFRNFLWVRMISSTENTEVKSIAIDNNNLVYVTGSNEGPADFGNGITLSNSNHSTNIFAARYDTDGNVIWAKQIGSSNHLDIPGGVETDKEGYVYFCGSFGSTPADPVTIEGTVMTYSGLNYFIVKYDSAGNYIWLRNTTNSGPSNRVINGFSIVNNEIYMTGYLEQGYATFETTTVGYGLSAFGFLAKYDTEGTFKWVKAYRSIVPQDVAADSLNNVFIAGKVRGNLYLENDTIPTAGSQYHDAFILCFDTLGNRRWHVLAGDVDYDGINAVTVDGLGNAYVTGDFRLTFQFMDTTVVCPFSGQQDLFVSKITGSGDFKWLKKGNGFFMDYGEAIHYEKFSSRVYIGGRFWNDVTYGSTTISDNGNADLMLIQLADTTFEVTPTVTNASCTSNCNGSILVMSNGARPFHYQWSNTAADTNYQENLCAGTYQLQVTDANGRVTNLEIEVGSEMLPHISFLFTVTDLCIDADPVAIGGANPPGGIYRVDGAPETVFDPGVLGAGSHTVSYTFSDAEACTDSVLHVITVHGLPAVSYTETNDSLCINEPAFDLLNASPSGGVYSGLGVNANSFDPGLAGAGNHTITYTYTDTYSCVNSISALIRVFSLPAVAYNETTSSVCAGEAAFELSPGTPSGGIYSGTAVDGSSFDPGQAGVGVHSVSYTYSDINACSVSVDQEITVFALPVVSLSLSEDILCENASSFMLSGGNPVGGSYSGNAVTNNEFTAANAGNGTHGITYTFTDVNSCSAAQTDSITVLDCAALNELSGLNILINPNPAQNEVHIATPNKVAGKIRLLDSNGKQLLEVSPFSEQSILNLDPFSNGIYIIEIEINGDRQRTKIVKQH